MTKTSTNFSDALSADLETLKNGEFPNIDARDAFGNAAKLIEFSRAYQVEEITLDLSRFIYLNRLPTCI